MPLWDNPLIFDILNDDTFTLPDLNDDGVEDEEEKLFQGLTVADLWDPNGVDGHKKKGVYVISSKRIDRVKDRERKLGIQVPHSCYKKVDSILQEVIMSIPENWTEALRACPEDLMYQLDSAAEAAGR